MQIHERFISGAIGAITALHGRHYARHWGFGTVFEARVAAELAAFAARMHAPDLVLLAEDDEGIAGSLILDLHDPASGARGAHLRWFIMASRCRGTGLGRRFMARAIEVACRCTDGRAWLTTFKGLDAARHLYESQGFRLVHEAPGEAWGTRVIEQEFRREGGGQGSLGPRAPGAAS